MAPTRKRIKSSAPFDDITTDGAKRKACKFLKSYQPIIISWISKLVPILEVQPVAEFE